MSKTRFLTGALLVGLAGSVSAQPASKRLRSEAQFLVPPQGGAFEVPVHAGEVCILSFPDHHDSTSIGCRRTAVQDHDDDGPGLGAVAARHGQPVSPPFVDTAFGGHPFTGVVGVSDVGCSTILRAADGTPEICIATRRVTAYRALKEVQVLISGVVSTAYRTAPTAQLHAIPAAGELTVQGFSWTTAAATLP